MVTLVPVSWVLLPILVHGFFYEKIADVYNVTLPDASLFGYSMEYMPSFESLIVSAPNADKWGRIYTVDWKNKTFTDLKITPELSRETKRGMWLGATLKASNDSLVICAPRFIVKHPEYILEVRGTCYNSNLREYHTMVTLPFAKPRNYYDFQLPFGWSVESLRDGRVLVGCAGHKGRVIVYNSLTSVPHYINEQEPGQNFGYSIACGSFSKKISCAIASTYEPKGFGTIYFYDSRFNVQSSVSDEEFLGTMFGAALTKVDLGAEHQHLVVGAPLTSGYYTYDVGAALLYGKDPNDDTKMVLLKKIPGHLSGGYFGNTIISLGDMDGDGKDEVAIAAPYENDRGAVYIYSGSVLLDVNSDTQPAQVIRPEKVQYFGLSMTRVENKDSGLNRLAIGAPESNTVVIFRSFASMKIDINVNLLNKTRQGDMLDVSFTTCLQFRYPKQIQTLRGDVRYNVEIPNILYQAAVTVSLNKAHRTICKTHVVSVVEKHIEQQILTYVVKDIAVTPDPRSLEEYDPARVVISSDSVFYKTGRFLISDCGGDTCVPRLKTSVVTSMKNNKYVIGSSNSEWFSMVITNDGNTAYAPCIQVEVVGATVLQPGSCSYREGGIVCTPRGALHNDSTWEIEKVLLETSGMTSSDEELELRYHVFGRCETIGNNQTHIQRITLLRDRKFNVTGTSSPNEKVNITSGEDDGERTVTHIYKIENIGLTNWVGVKSEITLPKVAYARYEISIVSDVSRSCLVNDAALSAGSPAVCELGNLFKDRPITVFINIQVTSKLLEVLEKTENPAVLTTALHLKLKDADAPVTCQSVSTTFQLLKATVALWIIIVSVCVGLLILLLIAFVLYKCGFLQRKKKAELVNLRKSVKRQSMRRSKRQSLQNANTEDAEDLEDLVPNNLDNEQKKQE